MEQKTYRIEETRLASLQEKVAKLNKRAIKLGVPQIVVTTLREELEEQWELNALESGMNFDRMQSELYCAVGSTPINVDLSRYHKTGYVRRFHVITVNGETPKFNGWSFAATIEHTPEGNIVRKSPYFEKELPTSYRECSPYCEHCKTNRYRKDTFIVIHDDNTTKQIGRNCLRDFLGHEDPEQLASAAELIYSLGELCQMAEDDSREFMGYGGGKLLIGLESFLEHVAEMTIQFGFHTRKQAEERGKSSTKDDALLNMFPPKGHKPTPISEDAKALASKTREYVLETLGTKEQTTDFEHNLLIAAKCEAIEERTCGIAAYLVAYYKRETEKAIERSKAKTSEFVGEVGKRYKGKQAFTLTYMGNSSFDSVYGVTFIHRFVDANGNRFVWKTGDSLNYEGMKQGALCKVEASVKEHKVWTPDGAKEGYKQTVITRCNVEVITPTASETPTQSNPPTQS